MIVLAYLLILLSAFLLWGLVAFLIQMASLLIIGKVVGIQKIMLNLVNYMSMASFIAGISQGFLSLWFGALILFWFSFPPTYILGVFLAVAFVIPTLTKVQQQSKKDNTTGLSLPENAASNEKMAQMFDMMQQKGGAAIQSGVSKTAIVGLIGRLTGVGIGVLNIILG
jgi:hypothetical protein